MAMEHNFFTFNENERVNRSQYRNYLKQSSFLGKVTIDSALRHSELISGVAGQPLLEGQLKFLAKVNFNHRSHKILNSKAKKLGFDRLSGEQAVQRLAQVQKFLSGIKQVKVPQGVRPILPINAQTNMALLLPASIFPSSGAINTALTSKLAQMLSPPKGHGDDSKPFSRNNLDFVVQNAFNAYMNQAKP
uniref:Pesticin domain-containing protein n=1 Tax=Heterorhabditis bacteriophora TaxID=37862 RepID=A0A1I7WNE9_HETBA